MAVSIVKGRGDRPAAMGSAQERAVLVAALAVVAVGAPSAAEPDVTRANRDESSHALDEGLRNPRTRYARRPHRRSRVGDR
jgi:hypothetical protein